MRFRVDLIVFTGCFASVFFLLSVFSSALAQEEQYSESSAQSEDTPGLSTVEEASYTLRKMLVTATKRVQLAQDVPFSLNVQSEEDIKRLNTTDLEDLSRNVAGLSIQNLGPGQSVVTIRGVSSGQIVRDQPGVKEQVGVYLDETPIS
ncbi:MAG: TonB-dependent receptor plug domain-containing protein, partial [Candidatus Dadabacteria bacterium]|nr:TonB-dependent receptor plug domain-containing protein [Candidatus Dadabacteria bacterium]